MIASILDAADVAGRKSEPCRDASIPIPETSDCVSHGKQTLKMYCVRGP